ncbi:O-antigen ligase [Sphingomonas sp. NFR15]|uniref:O-antigen ligase family protein n=1 Tax=Sphingomonas sp. NFR15 TaxID=1566282 RepID=UPI000891E98E|nr:O-antigen ligase family protein [Sphingomonas sp. NFR15]SDA36736.1 O-antigen ligase like membrane protein [Sphingomonas sp. NFR15]
MDELRDRVRAAGLFAPECVAALLLLAAGIILGGSSRPSIGNLLVQLLALAILTWLVIRRRIALPPGRAARIAVWLMLAIAALPLLYSLPLPPAVWSRVPGRDLALRTYAIAGITPPWHGLGLRDGVGVLSALHLLAPLVMFLVAVRLTVVQRWALLYGFLAVTLLAILVGFAQVPGGASHALHFYDISSINGALGFFPNRNHMATLMLCTLPLAAAGALAWFRERGDEARGLALAGATLFGLAIVGLAATSARAGLVLAVPVLIGCALLARVMPRGSRAAGGISPLVLWGAICLAMIAVVGGLAYSSIGDALVTRVQTQGVVDADRIAFARLTISAIPRFLPFGSGPATFPAIYAMVEPLADMRPYFINHAHDDYLEILLEYGVPGAVLLLAALAWLGWAGIAAWFAADAPDRPIRCAASVGVAAILLHSTFDYPVRTTTIAILLALLAALMMAAAPSAEAPRPKRVKRRTRIRIA